MRKLTLEDFLLKPQEAIDLMNEELEKDYEHQTHTEFKFVTMDEFNQKDREWELIGMFQADSIKEGFREEVTKEFNNEYVDGYYKYQESGWGTTTLRTPFKMVQTYCLIGKKKASYFEETKTYLNCLLAELKQFHNEKNKFDKEMDMLKSNNEEFREAYQEECKVVNKLIEEKKPLLDTVNKLESDINKLKEYVGVKVYNELTNEKA